MAEPKTVTGYSVRNSPLPVPSVPKEIGKQKLLKEDGLIYSLAKPGTEQTKFLSPGSVAVLHFTAKIELKLRQ